MLHHLKNIRKLNKSGLYDFLGKDMKGIPPSWQPLYEDLKKSQSSYLIKNSAMLLTVLTGFLICLFTFVRYLSIFLYGTSGNHTFYLIWNTIFFPALIALSFLWILYQIQGIEFPNTYVSHSIRKESQIPLEILTDIFNHSYFLRNQSKTQVFQIMDFLKSYHHLWEQIHFDYVNNGISPSSSFDKLFTDVFLYDYPKYLENQDNIRKQTILALRTLCAISDFETEANQEHKYFLESKIQEISEEQLADLKKHFDENINRVLSQKPLNFNIQDINKYLQ